MPLDTRQITYTDGEQRFYYKCHICKKAKNILPYDAKFLTHLEKCSCRQSHYQQNLDLRILPLYNPLEDWK